MKKNIAFNTSKPNKHQKKSICVCCRGQFDPYQLTLIVIITHNAWINVHKQSDKKWKFKTKLTQFIFFFIIIYHSFLCVRFVHQFSVRELISIIFFDIFHPIHKMVINKDRCSLIDTQLQHHIIPIIFFFHSFNGIDYNICVAFFLDKLKKKTCIFLCVYFF